MTRFPYFVKTREGKVVPNMFMVGYIMLPCLIAANAWSNTSWTFGKACYFVAVFALAPAFFNAFCYAFESIVGSKCKSFYSKPE